MVLIRKQIVPNETIEKVLKPVVLANISLNPRHSNVLIEIEGELVNCNSDRYKCFFTHGMTCVECGVVGTIWALERVHTTKRYHLNLYGITADGKEVLMTKDHIMPKKFGGKDHLDNYQTMCIVCNNAKDQVPSKNKSINDTRIPEEFLIYRPVIGPRCPYCGSDSVLVDAKYLFDDGEYGQVYVCVAHPECDAWVGCHKDSDEPLGPLANSRLRLLQQKAHELFEKTWKAEKMSVTDAYIRLRELVGFKKDQQCHFGMFGEKTCNKLIKFCEGGKFNKHK